MGVNTIKRVEGETLRTFREEIPSIYFSDKTEKDYAKYIDNAEYIYRDLLKFPPKMFDGASLIDFGAGTGENTVYLANWGASCTLVEMNELAQNISRDVFKRYSGNFDKHRFVHSSIFDYEAPEKYDIVHCRGVLSHTAAKEEGFRKIAGFLKPGGYLIFGDPNKAGGFQNMLQRFAVYHFAKSTSEMVDVSEMLFKEDIDRSQSFVPRTRRSIIFDRWVIQSQDDPSVAEVTKWMKDSGLRLYSTYPPVALPLADSVHHQPKLDPFSVNFAVTELVWMLHTDPDTTSVKASRSVLEGFSARFGEMTSYMANFNSRSKLDGATFKRLSDELRESAQSLQLLEHIKTKLSEFLHEANEFVEITLRGDLKALREFIVSAKVLFKGAAGVRHVDFIAYKPQ